MKKLLSLTIGLALAGTANLVSAEDLAQVYQQAKENDPQLLSAAAQKDAAFEAINESRAALLPQIDLTAGYNKTLSNRDANENDVLSAGVSLNQLIYNQQSWSNLDITEMSARQADAGYAAQQQGLILRTATAYFEVLRAMDNLDFIRAEKAAVGRQLEQTKQRFEVGLSAITDVHDAQAQYDSVLAQEIIARNTLTNSYEGLRELTGQEYAEINALNTRQFSAQRETTPITDLEATAQEKNLTLLAQRIARDRAKEQISLAQGGHLPTVAFTANYGHNHVNNDHPVPGALPDEISATDLTMGINASLPLFSGGATSSQVKQAQFGYVAASQDLEASYREVIKDVRAFYNNINATMGALRAYQQSVVSARSALKATEAGFEVGTRTIVDVLDATRRLYDANRNLADARYDYILSVLQLKLAVGTLSDQDIVDINKSLTVKKATRK
ncbi:Outer membrane protein TolC [Vibrio stylophorae]|uniref:Outer membrane protein TolC n=1 Tax=Vibrio stylophorae TaxID=659351 RepID=A0ABN8DYC8_9VIBR|nr:outer membrane channel protein TolC [Vibrio stylophorae]CAH0534387.1 Outer membrane protein TolC [Vibrio stylophorae]